MSNENIIECKDLNKYYSGVHALKNLSLKIQKFFTLKHQNNTEELHISKFSELINYPETPRIIEIFLLKSMI